jgi:hypothetical protein
MREALSKKQFLLENRGENRLKFYYFATGWVVHGDGKN